MIPIVMAVLTLTLKYPAIHWANIVVTILWVPFISLAFLVTLDRQIPAGF